jgi:hypothetical protein
MHENSRVMSPNAFSINTSLAIKANKSIENASETQSLGANSISECPLSEGIEEFKLSDELGLSEYLQKYSEASLTEFANFAGLFDEDRQSMVADLFTESIDELDLDESEAEQYIKDFIEDDSREELNSIANSINATKHDIFDAIFECSSWEIRDLTVSDDPEFPHEIGIFFCLSVI